VTLGSSPCSGLFICNPSVYTNPCGSTPTTVTTLGGGISISNSSVVTLSAAGSYRFICTCAYNSSVALQTFAVSASSGTLPDLTNNNFGGGTIFSVIFHLYGANASTTITFSCNNTYFTSGTWVLDVTQL